MNGLITLAGQWFLTYLIFTSCANPKSQLLMVLAMGCMIFTTDIKGTKK